jgi:hypothetical protein
MLFTEAVFCQSTISFDWAKHGGGSSYDFIRCVTTDSKSNTYIAGFFTDSANLNLSEGSPYSISKGYRDAFITKISPQGIALWTKTFGGIDYDLIQAIDVDELDNVYITGFFSESMNIDFGSSSSNFISKGDRDAFVGKLSSSGEMMWFKTLGAAGEDYGTCISTKNGKVCIGGTFNQTILLDEFSSTNSLISNGGRDAYVICLDTLGNYIWSVDYGGSLSDYNYAVEINENGSVFASGSFRNLVDFDPGPNFDYHGSTGLSDSYLLKLDPNGNFNWCNTLGGVGNDTYRDIELKDDKIYVSGFFSDSVNLVLFDNSTETIKSLGGFDIIVSQYDTSAQLRWSKTAGSINDDYSYALKSDGQGIVVQGTFSDTLFLEDSNEKLISKGSNDIFLLKINELSNFNWSISTGGLAAEYPAGFDISSSGKIVSAGYFYGDGDFGYDSPTILNSRGKSDFFIQSLNYCSSSNINTVQEFVVCNSYTWPLNNTTYSSSTSSPFVTLSNINGCDSIVRLNLTITNSTLGNDIQTACNSYLWIDGNTYTTSNNTATHTISNLAGCDSLVTLNLTINELPELNAIGTTTICAGESTLISVSGASTYEWDNDLGTNSSFSVSPTTTTSYTITGTDTNTCVNSTQVTVTVNPKPNVNVSQLGRVLTAQVLKADISYQWVNCSRNYMNIPGEIEPVYNANANGSYAIIINENGCTDTSSCYDIVSVGIIENNFGNELVIYPNPTKGDFSIDLGQNIQNIKITIMDVTGKTILSKAYKNNHLLNLKIEEPMGIYFLRVESKENTAVFKLLKE